MEKAPLRPVRESSDSSMIYRERAALEIVEFKDAAVIGNEADMMRDAITLDTAFYFDD